MGDKDSFYNDDAIYCSLNSTNEYNGLHVLTRLSPTKTILIISHVKIISSCYNCLMKLQDLYKNKNTQHNGIFEWVKPVISFEIFPPDKEDPNQALCEEIKILNRFEPAFFL